MRVITRALAELVGVLIAGFVAFFLMIAYAAGFLMLLACGFACAGFLLVALFGMIMWLFTHNVHAFHVMVGYFAYAGAAYAVIAAMSYYHGKLNDHLSARPRRQAALRRKAGLRLVTDVNFEQATSSARRCSYCPPDL
jgi:hypothetical protein